jgi:hypothetical protein
MRPQPISRRLFLALLIPVTQVFQPGCSRRLEDPGITTTSPLPSATVGTAYREQLAASGGSAPYTFVITSGQVPAGLTLSAAGLLSGTPTTAGTATFAVQASNSTGVTSAPKTLTVTVAAARTANTAGDAGAGGAAGAAAAAAAGTLAADGYPRYGQMDIGGSFNFDSAYQQCAGLCQLNITTWYLGGEPYAGGYTMAQVAQNTASNGAANGITARTLPYSDLQIWPENLSVNSGWHSATAINAVQRAGSGGWWLRTSYPSGSIVLDPDYAPDSGMPNPAAGGSTYSVPATGYDGDGNEVLTYLEYNFLTQGNAVTTFGEAHAVVANAYLSGSYHDNQSPVTLFAGAWEGNGTSYAAGDSVITPLLQAGYAQQLANLRSLWGSAALPSGQPLVCCGNVSYGPGGYSSSDLFAMEGLYDCSWFEQIAGLSWSVESFGGWSGGINSIIQQEQTLTANGAVYANFCGANNTTWSSNTQSSWTANDWQMLRYVEALLLMRGTGIAISAQGGNYNAINLRSDTMNAGAGGLTGSSVPNLQWLGAGSGTFDPPQSSAQFASGIWARHYPGGIAIANPRGNSAGAVMITVGAGGMLPGGAYKFMPCGGYSDPSINTGATITSSFTLAPGDARILVAL